MTPKELIDYYGGTQELAADGLGCNQSTISDWSRAGRIPGPRQIFIELKTNRALKADPGCLENAIRFKPRQAKKPKRRSTEQQGA